MKEWKACVAFDNVPRAYHYCAIMVPRPSITEFSKETEKFHARLRCGETKITRQKWVTAIAKNKKESKKHWLLIFPPHVQLDNRIFGDSLSHTTEEIKTNFKHMRKDNPTNTTITPTLYYTGN
eukprot:7812839-Ditylum_brightwellii.AAC.1